MSRTHCPTTAKREITAISFVTALCLCGDSFLYVALPLYWEAAGLGSLFEVGIILAANRVVRLPLNPLITLFYNRFSCWTGLLLASLLAIISTAGYGLGQGLLFWVAMRFVWGLSWTLLRLGTLFSILRVGKPHTLGYLTGINNGLYRLGSLGGMLLGGILADSFGLQTAAFVFAGVSCLAPIVLIRMVPKDTTPRGMQAGRRGLDIREVFSVHPGSVLWIMMTGFLVALTYQGLTASTISMLLDAHSNETFAILGLTISATAISGGLQALRWVWEPFLAPFFGALSDGKLGCCRLSAVAFGLAAATLLLGALDLDLGPLCLAILLVLLVATLLTTATDTLGNDAAVLSPNSRTFLATFALFTDLGAAVGPIFAYVVITLGSTGLSWVLTSILLAVFAVYWWTHPTLPRAHTQPS